MRRSAVVAVIVVCTATPCLAEGPDDEGQARILFEQAEAQFANKAFEAALKLYEQAYKLRQLPGFLFNIGQCQRFLGQYQAALFSYRRYLARLPQTPNRDQTEELIELMQQLIARQDAQRQATGPVSRPVRPAAVAQPAETQRPSSAPASLPGVVPRVDAPSRTRRALAALPTAERAHAGSDKGDKGAPAGSEDHGSRGAFWLWGGACLSAALLTTGAITGLLASDRSNEYNDRYTSVERRKEIKPTGEALGTTSIATLSAGAAVGVATLVYYFISYRNAGEGAPAAVVLSGTTVSAVVRF